jgi:hypothetical protein
VPQPHRIAEPGNTTADSKRHGKDIKDVNMKPLLLLPALVLITGCASLQNINAPWRKPIQPLTYQEIYEFATEPKADVVPGENDKGAAEDQPRPTLRRKAYDELPQYIKDMAGVFKRDSKLSQANSTSQQEAATFLESGMIVTNMLCSAYMLQVTQKQQQRRYGRDLASNTNTALSTVLNLTKSSNLATGITSALFGGLDVNYQNWDAHYVASVDLPLAETLVRYAMERQAQENAARSKAAGFTYRQAESRLQQYASTCSFNGIKTLINQSVSAGKNNLVVDETGAANADSNPASGLIKAMELQASAINAFRQCDLQAAAAAFAMAKDSHPVYGSNQQLIDALRASEPDRAKVKSIVKTMGIDPPLQCFP